MKKKTVLHLIHDVRGPVRENKYCADIILKVKGMHIKN